MEIAIDLNTYQHWSKIKLWSDIYLVEIVVHDWYRKNKEKPYAFIDPSRRLSYPPEVFFNK